MERPIVGDIFKVKKNFNFGKKSFDEGELVSVVIVAGLPWVDMNYLITLLSPLKHREFTLTVENFNVYIQDGYFERVDNKKEDNMSEQFKLEVGDIVVTKEDTLTIVKDTNSVLYAVSHIDYNMLEVEGMFVKYERADSEIRKVHRHSVYSGENFDYDDYTLTTKTQVYPHPKVKLTLSQIKKHFQIENEDVEIDFEN